MSGARQFLFGVAVTVAIVASSVLALSRGGGGVAPAAQAATATTPDQLAPYLRFSGTGTVRVKPDTATISFSTNGEDSSKAAAVNEASVAMRHVIAAMTQGGVSHADLQTSMSVYKDSSRGLYEADEELQVTVRHGSAKTLLSAGLNAGADNSSGPYWSLTDQNKGYEAALRAAVASARAHADAAAALIGAHVTGVVSIDDSGQTFDQPYPMAFRAAADSVAGVPVERGSQDVTATVTAVFTYATNG
jgi:uncharacterized protein